MVVLLSRYPITSLDGSSQFGVIDISFSLKDCSAVEASKEISDNKFVQGWFFAM